MSPEAIEAQQVTRNGASQTAIKVRGKGGREGERDRLRADRAREMGAESEVSERGVDRKRERGVGIRKQTDRQKQRERGLEAYGDRVGEGLLINRHEWCNHWHIYDAFCGTTGVSVTLLCIAHHHSQDARGHSVLQC